MEKKLYMQPSLKAIDIDEELLAAISEPVIDEDEETEDLARQHTGWGFDEEGQPAKKRGVWDE